MKIIKRIRILVGDFCKDNKNFGLKVAISSFIFFFASRFPGNRLSELFIKWKHSTVLSYLHLHFSDIINQCREFTSNTNTKESCIWICWWQGEEFLDEITSCCVHSIKEHANGHKIVVITKDNYIDYVKIPSFIMDKLNSGVISFTQFSDILRMTLLNTHGGLWLDATMLVTKNISEDIFNRGLYTRKGPKRGFYVSDCQWTGFFIGGKPNVLFHYMNAMFFAYWKKENRLIDYYLIDYLIRLGYETIPEVRELINKVPFNNPELHSLESYMNLAYNPDIYRQLTENTSFFKLSRKTIHIKETKDGQDTFYKMMINDKL